MVACEHACHNTQIVIYGTPLEVLHSHHFGFVFSLLFLSFLRLAIIIDLDAALLSTKVNFVYSYITFL